MVYEVEILLGHFIFYTHGKLELYKTVVVPGKVFVVGC